MMQLYSNWCGDEMGMIYITTRDFNNKLYLCIREWDGYDKPDYSYFLELSENERHLNDGRFKFFTYKKSNFKIKIVTWKSSTIKVKETMSNIINWISENINNEWSLHVIDPNEFIFEFHFETNRDAINFKLVWG